ncbi:hypothetical protein [Acidisoma silvae]|uniref:Uncharacterized protein n=1 Tax=Acidisoma silvae TaxID=2802396 RepID=A0A964E0X2_9PROT|nr:hypothetical protein [Acidisoma silvae]MCB8877604.1 hypothetical protein [Acidisoma silvae]
MSAAVSFHQTPACVIMPWQNYGVRSKRNRVMADDDEATPSTEWSLPTLPEPEGSSESFAAYVERVIFSALLRPAARRAREVGIFLPAHFTLRSVCALHEGADYVHTRAADYLRPVLDHLWLANHPGRLPLAVRMAKLKPIDLDFEASDPVIEPPDFAAWRLAALRRDLLMAALCEKLRAGEFLCTGIAPNDLTRTPIAIGQAWWGDDSFHVNARQGESAADSAAVMPPLRGFMLRSAAAVMSSALVPTAGNELKAPSHRMLAALEELLASGTTFRDVTEAHSAVMRHLEIKDAPRGYTYKNFYRLAAGRLRRD